MRIVTPQTIGKKEEFFEKVMSADELYGKIGNPAHGFQQYFPVVHVKTTEGFRTTHASRLLFHAGCAFYLLTGKMVTEYTIASTSVAESGNTQIR